MRLRGRQVPERVQLDHDVHLVADRAADLAKRLERLVQLLRTDVVPAPALGGEVERPDLHAGDVLLEQAVRQLVGAMQEGIEIFVRACGLAGGQAPVVGQLTDVLAHVAIAGAGVVDADLRARQTAQQLMDRLAGRLAENVPERDVERGQAAHLGAAAGEPDVGVEQRARVPVDRERVLAQQARRRRLVDVGDRGVRSEERFAEAEQALVGVHVHPEQIRELVELNGLDRADPHAVPSSAPAS